MNGIIMACIVAGSLQWGDACQQEKPIKFFQNTVYYKFQKKVKRKKRLRKYIKEQSAKLTNLKFVEKKRGKLKKGIIIGYLDRSVTSAGRAFFPGIEETDNSLEVTKCFAGIRNYSNLDYLERLTWHEMVHCVGGAHHDDITGIMYGRGLQFDSFFLDSTIDVLDTFYNSPSTDVDTDGNEKQ